MTDATKGFLTDLFHMHIENVAGDPSELVQHDTEESIEAIEAVGEDLGVDVWAYLREHRSEYEVTRLQHIKDHGEYPTDKNVVTLTVRRHKQDITVALRFNPLISVSGHPHTGDGGLWVIGDVVDEDGDTVRLTQDEELRVMVRAQNGEDETGR